MHPFLMPLEEDDLEPPPPLYKKQVATPPTNDFHSLPDDSSKILPKSSSHPTSKDQLRKPDEEKLKSSSPTADRVPSKRRKSTSKAVRLSQTSSGELEKEKVTFSDVESLVVQEEKKVETKRRRTSILFFEKKSADSSPEPSKSKRLGRSNKTLSNSTSSLPSLSQSHEQLPERKRTTKTLSLQSSPAPSPPEKRRSQELPKFQVPTMEKEKLRITAQTERAEKKKRRFTTQLERTRVENETPTPGEQKDDKGKGIVVEKEKRARKKRLSLGSKDMIIPKDRTLSASPQPKRRKETSKIVAAEDYLIVVHPVPPLPPKDPNVWKWRRGSEWVSYDVETCQIIDRAYESDKYEVALNHGWFAGQGYSIKFQKMIQTKEGASVPRFVQRVDPDSIVSWYFYATDCWRRFDEDIGMALEQGFQDCYPSVALEGKYIGRGYYVVMDDGKMLQKCVSDDTKKRGVMREHGRSICFLYPGVVNIVPAFPKPVIPYVGGIDHLHKEIQRAHEGKVDHSFRTQNKF